MKLNDQDNVTQLTGNIFVNLKPYCLLESLGGNYSCLVSLSGCTESEFNCDDGLCVDMSRRCDGSNHCRKVLNNKKLIQSLIMLTQFHCGKITYVNLAMHLKMFSKFFLVGGWDVIDRIINKYNVDICSDGSDEMNCNILSKGIRQCRQFINLGQKIEIYWIW